MKQFLKFVLATLVGLVIFCFLGIFFLIGLVTSASGKQKKAAVEANSVLKIDLNYPIHEKTEENPFAALDLSNPKMKKAIGLTDIRACIAKAKTDDNIKGILLESGLNENGLATLKVIRDALLD